MEPYQEEYLTLLHDVAKCAKPNLELRDSDAFIAQVRQANLASREAVEKGTRLLREHLFPRLDDILSASEEELQNLYAFTEKLMSVSDQRDVGLHYRIHMSLMNYARSKGLRDMLIRELYWVGMALHNLETMLRPNRIWLFSARMRMCFAECASYFETEYDQITDPETRGYIHRSMGNIALSYDGRKKEEAEEKLKVLERSIRILSDPDIQAKTPSLPWNVYIYKSHQERTTLLSYLRSGMASPEAFAQVMESAQIVQDRQRRAAQKRGTPMSLSTQYTYLAARYHCGAIQLPELLESLYALTTPAAEDDFGENGIFAHVSGPAFYIAYTGLLEDEQLKEIAKRRSGRLTKRMLQWLAHAPNSELNELLMFNLRQFLIVYQEPDEGIPFIEVLESVVAARQPVNFIRMWMAGRIARELCGWAIEDCPDQLAGIPGFERTADVIWQREALMDFADKAGRLYDVGMINFSSMENLACRGLFEEEETMLQLHPWFGASQLGKHASTMAFKDIAYGHHCHYDGKGGGYPRDFSVRSSPYKPVIYLISAVDTLVCTTEEGASRNCPVSTFDEAVRQLMEGKGTVYAPFVVDLLQKPERREALRRRMADWRQEAYLELYRLLESLENFGETKENAG